eukprot:6635983-Pyramimonas_sp.AAC.1
MRIQNGSGVVRLVRTAGDLYQMHVAGYAADLYDLYDVVYCAVGAWWCEIVSPTPLPHGRSLPSPSFAGRGSFMLVLLRAFLVLCCLLYTSPSPRDRSLS